MWLPDWSLLAPELLQFVSEKITCITDFIYFRAVCRSWRQATLSKPTHLPPQVPWLLFPVASENGILEESKILFYDLKRSKQCMLNDPILLGSRKCGVSRGWIIIETKKEVTLLNPVTRARIPVPSLSCVPTIFPTQQKSMRCPANWILRANSYDGSYMEKAIVTSTPSHTGCIVVGLFTSNWEIAFCKIGDEKWTLIEGYCNGFDNSKPHTQDIAWHHDKLYAINHVGRVFIYDLHCPSKQYVDPDFGSLLYVRLHLVEGASKLMVVIRPPPIFQMTDGKFNQPGYTDLRNAVYEWRNDGHQDLHKLCDIGDVVLFINSSYVCISIPSDKLESSRWHGSKICSEIFGSDNPALLKIEDLRHEDVENIDTKISIPSYIGTPLWLTPCYL